MPAGSRRAADTAQRVHHAVLQDQLRKLSAVLGGGLAVCNDQDLPQHHVITPEHGEQRWEAGWSLSEVVRDYQILRLVVIDYLDGQLDRPLNTGEAMAVGLAIDEACMASIQAYVKYGDQVRQEQEQARLNLERRTNEALRQSAAELEQAQRRTNEFLATLAVPLNCAIPCADLFAAETARMQGSSDPATAETWEVVERQVEQMTRLVDDLLDVTRISQGKLHCAAGPTWAKFCASPTELCPADAISLAGTAGELVRQACSWKPIRPGWCKLSATCSRTRLSIRP